jgi:hypothetical protein
MIMSPLFKEIRDNPLLWSLAFVPVVFVAQKLKPGAHTLLFVLSVVAIVPLATLLSHATESVVAKPGTQSEGCLTPRWAISPNWSSRWRPYRQGNTPTLNGKGRCWRLGMRMANFAARMGFLHQDLAIFRHAFRILKVFRTSRKTEATAQVPEISLSVRLNQAFRQVMPGHQGGQTDYAAELVARRLRMEPAGPPAESAGRLKRAA